MSCLCFFFPLSSSSVFCREAVRLQLSCVHVFLVLVLFLSGFVLPPRSWPLFVPAARLSVLIFLTPNRYWVKWGNNSRKKYASYRGQAFIFTSKFPFFLPLLTASPTKYTHTPPGSYQQSNTEPLAGWVLTRGVVKRHLHAHPHTNTGNYSVICTYRPVYTLPLIHKRIHVQNWSPFEVGACTWQLGTDKSII